MLKFWKRLITPPLVLAAAMWLFVEDWLWDGFIALLARLSRLPAVRAAEAWVAKLSPYPAMALFLIPAALMLPFKIAGLWLIAAGHALMGIGVFAAAKIVGTAMLAWIYALCRPTLLSVAWFARVVAAFQRFRAWVRARLTELGVYKAAAAMVHRARQWVNRLRGGMLRRRWLAIRRLRKRRANAPT